MSLRIPATAVALLLAAAACGRGSPPPDAATPPAVEGTQVAVLDTIVSAHFEATGTAQPIADATLSTKLMGRITAVLVREGAQVAGGVSLVTIDATDIDAKDAQVKAGIAGAEASFQDASLQATRIRALYADSAAPRAQLDAVEAGLTRARAGLAAAQASQSEVAAIRSYGDVRAPFAGVVTRRFVDPGDFAAPGAPLMTVQDISSLRIVATVPASLAAAIRRGTTLHARIEGAEVAAVVEGVVPSAGAMYTVNAIVRNADRRFPSGGAAALDVPTGTTEHALFVPNRAVVREGDLTGVHVMHDGRSELRWVRLGAALGARTRVLSGLAAGDVVVVPTAGR